MPVVLDLFGDPVPLNRGRKGRPAHVPTAQNRGLVTMLVATGHKPDDIAAVLRVSMPTLRKHYFSELGDSKIERMRVRGKLLVQMMTEALKGNVGAGKFIAGELARAELGTTPDAAKAKAPAKATPLGKKEEERLAAYGAGRETGWQDLLTTH